MNLYRRIFQNQILICMIQLIIHNLSISDLHAKEFNSFDQLNRHYKEGKDFKIQSLDRSKPCTAMAIHGGRIESFTSELAESLAKSDMNLYTFEGIREKENRALHLTSHLFNEPKALQLAAKSKYCFSFHGKSDDNVDPHICLGGGNHHLITALRVGLGDMGFLVYTNQSLCRELQGKSPKNIVNKCQNPGVQFEISAQLRQKFASKPEFTEEFTSRLRKIFTSLCNLKRTDTKK